MLGICAKVSSAMAHRRSIAHTESVPNRNVSLRGENILLLELHAAKGLRDVQTLGEMDPYAVASVHPGGEKERTRTVASGGTQFRWGVGHGRRLELLLPLDYRCLGIQQC